MSFSDREREFFTACSASTIVPHRTNESLSETIHNSDKRDEASLLDVKQRDSVFFDERLNIYLILQVPECAEEELKAYLSRIDLKVEIWVTNNPDGQKFQSGTSSPDRDLICSEKIKQNGEPIVLVSQSEDDDRLFLNLVWEKTVTLSRPRIRLPEAFALVTPVVTVSPQEDLHSGGTYLVPFQVPEPNIFDPLRGAEGIGDDPPYLPISRLRSVAPMQPKKDHSFYLRNTPLRPIHAYPAVITRLRYVRVNTFDPTPSTVASLDIEVIPFVNIRGRIEKAEVSLASGKVTPFMQDLLPLDCQSKDCITFLYRLDQVKGDSVASSKSVTGSANVDLLSVSITIAITVDNECTPSINMNWTANVDFTQALNTLFGPPSQPLARPNRPTSLPFGSNNPNVPPSDSITLLPAPQIDARRALTISFSAPKTSGQVGAPFTWKLLIVNGTDKVAKLAIIPLPRVQRLLSQAQQFARRHAPKSSITSINMTEKSGRKNAEEADMAQAVMDENVVYAMQHSGAIPSETDLMSMTPELRIGPLGPGQCLETEIKLVAFRPGAFVLDAIRVVDLMKEAELGPGGQGVITDIRELPDIVIE